MNEEEDLPLTPEEQAATRRLERAIQEFLEVFEAPSVLIDWALVTATTAVGPDGDDVTTSCWTSDLQPRYRTLGLLAVADQTVRGTIF